jgi:hypothetical protein
MLAGGFLAAFFIYIPIGEIYRVVHSANLILFGMAVLLGVPGIFLSTLSTWLLAHRQGITSPLWEFFLFNMSIRFYSFFFPTSAISTAMRWHKLSAGSKKAEALSAIAFTRAMSIFAALFLGMFWLLSGIEQEVINPLFFVLFILLFLAGWLVVTRLSPSLARAFHRLSAAFDNRWMKRIAGFAGRLFASVEAYAQMSLSALAGIGLINLANELLGVVSYVLIAWAMDVPLSFVNLGWLRSIAFLAALAPFTLAGGMGLREVTILVILSTFEVEPEVAAGYSFLIYARGAVFALLCGVLELVSASKSR